mmetsp:Transcript_4055/g.9542  ORF Transcript_4055/g.9542 Transcript_4055/m.9542 type:complete len:268 (-) Transcript_4055:1990-2793(-)
MRRSRKLLRATSMVVPSWSRTPSQRGSPAKSVQALAPMMEPSARQRFCVTSQRACRATCRIHSTRCRSASPAESPARGSTSTSAPSMAVDGMAPSACVVSEIPTVAADSAGASLMPSPTITSPPVETPRARVRRAPNDVLADSASINALSSSCTLASLSSGRRSANTPANVASPPSLVATLLAFTRRSPVSMYTGPRRAILRRTDGAEDLTWSTNSICQASTASGSSSPELRPSIPKATVTRPAVGPSSRAAAPFRISAATSMPRAP